MLITILMFIFSKFLLVIFFRANLVLKSKILKIDQNLVQGYITIRLFSMLMFIFFKSFTIHMILGNLVPKSEVVPIDWSLAFAHFFG